MTLLRACISTLIAISIPTLFFFALWYNQGSYHISQWDEFAKGLITGISIAGIPLGILIVREFYKDPRINNKHNRSYSA